MVDDSSHPLSTLFLYVPSKRSKLFLKLSPSLDLFAITEPRTPARVLFSYAKAFSRARSFLSP